MRRIAFLVGLCILITFPLADRAAARHRSHHVHKRQHLRRLALAGNRRAIQYLSAPQSFCAGEDKGGASVSAQEAAMKCMLNYARQQAGLPRLNNTSTLDSSAAMKAGDILRCDQFSHYACGRDFLYWFRRGGYLNARCWWAGENLAWGTGNKGTPHALMDAWMASPDHRANILSARYQQFGIAFRVGTLEGRTDVHLWVNHFGEHC